MAFEPLVKLENGSWIFLSMVIAVTVNHKRSIHSECNSTPGVWLRIPDGTECHADEFLETANDEESQVMADKYAGLINDTNKLLSEEVRLKWFHCEPDVTKVMNFYASFLRELRQLKVKLEDCTRKELDEYFTQFLDAEIANKPELRGA